MVVVAPMVGALAFIALIAAGLVDPDTASEAEFAFAIFVPWGLSIVVLLLGSRKYRKNDKLLAK
jgi:hypothetical protein